MSALSKPDLNVLILRPAKAKPRQYSPEARLRARRFGAKLKAAREAAGFAIGPLARRARVDAGTWCHYEEGYHFPVNRNTQARLAAAVGVEHAWLCAADDDVRVPFQRPAGGRQAATMTIREWAAVAICAHMARPGQKHAQIAADAVAQTDALIQAINEVPE